MADVRRLAAYYDLPLRPTRPRRPNTIPALCLAKLLQEGQRARFSDAVFVALWQEQQDVSDPAVLARCLDQAGCSDQGTDAAFAEAGRADLARDSAEAYARGIFGVPSFVIGDDMFFGHDRLDLLLWDIGRKERVTDSPGEADRSAVMTRGPRSGRQHHVRQKSSVRKAMQR